MSAFSNRDESVQEQDRKAVEAYLRPEPNSLSWKSLNTSQREAFVQIAHSLKEALEGVSGDSKLAKETTAFYELQPSAVKRMVWLDAGRGMGKTTLLKSAARAVADGNAWDQEIENDFKGGPNKPCTCEVYSRIEKDVQKIQGRFVWLEPLELELLPGPTNLLAAILARVEDTLRRIAGPRHMEDRQRGLLERRTPTDKAVDDLAKLMNQVSLAWDGNAKERAANVEPDTFSREVNRSERARLEVPVLFRKVLEALATEFDWGKSVNNPVFVVSIDDCDLSPERCLEILRLLRLIDSPRLFTIVLGDIKNAHEVVQLKFAGDRARIAGMELGQDVQKSEFYDQQRYLTFEAMRKLVPPNQRICLMPMTSMEVLAYRPGLIQASIGEILDKIKIHVRLSAAAGASETASTLLKFLTGAVVPAPAMDSKSPSTSDAAGKTPDPPEKPAATEKSSLEFSYGALARYQVPPRVVADLWFRLQRLSEQARQTHQTLRAQDVLRTQQALRGEYFRTANSLFEDAIHADGQLTDAQQQRILKTFQPRVSDSPSWQVAPEYTTVACEEAVKSEVATQETLLPATTCRTQYDGKWVIRPTPSESKESRLPTLACAATAMFCLTHDLIHLMQLQAEPSCVSNVSMKDVAVTIHDFSYAGSGLEGKQISVNWPVPEFTLFWDWDRFLSVWKRANRSLQLWIPPSKDSAPTQLAFLAYWWIAGAVSVYSGDSALPLADIKVVDDRKSQRELWAQLGNRVRALVGRISSEQQNRVSRSGPGGIARLRNWLEQLAFLIAPEGGLPDDLRQAFLSEGSSTLTNSASDKKSSLIDFWSVAERANRIRRQRNRLAIDVLCSVSHVARDLLQDKLGKDAPRKETLEDPQLLKWLLEESSGVEQLQQLLSEKAEQQHWMASLLAPDGHASYADASAALKELTVLLHKFSVLCPATFAAYQPPLDGAAPKGKFTTADLKEYFKSLKVGSDDFQSKPDLVKDLVVHLENSHWRSRIKNEAKRQKLDLLLETIMQQRDTVKSLEGSSNWRDPFLPGEKLFPGDDRSQETQFAGSEHFRQIDLDDDPIFGKRGIHQATSSESQNR